MSAEKKEAAHAADENEKALTVADKPQGIGVFSSSGNFEAAQRMAIALSKSTIVPKIYQDAKDNPSAVANCIIALETANRIGASPLLVMQNLYIVHGTPGWSSKFLIACLNTCGKFTSIRYEPCGTAGNDDYGTRACAVEKATGNAVFGAWVTIGMAKKEGWYAKSGTPAAIFSLEMSGVQLADRLLLSEAEGVNADHFRSGFSSREELRELEEAGKRAALLPIHVDDSSDISMAQIRAKARRLHRQGKCGILFIDYLQLCRERGDKNRNKEQEVSAMSREAKIIAKELNIPVVLLSQLSREVERRGGDMRPRLSDLRDSGGIEQDADMVAFVYRPSYYHRDAEDEQGKPYGDSYGELIFAKNRNGRTGTVAWRHNESLTKIYDDGEAQNCYEPYGSMEANVEF
jgi:replicative DNA helicase